MEVCFLFASGDGDLSRGSCERRTQQERLAEGRLTYREMRDWPAAWKVLRLLLAEKDCRDAWEMVVGSHCFCCCEGVWRVQKNARTIQVGAWQCHAYPSTSHLGDF